MLYKYYIDNVVDNKLIPDQISGRFTSSFVRYTAGNFMLFVCMYNLLIKHIILACTVHTIVLHSLTFYAFCLHVQPIDETYYISLYSTHYKY